MKKTKLDLALENELKQLYHNATVAYPRLDSDYEQDLFDSWFADHASMAVDDIEHNETLRDILTYGKVYQWGRGGRTLAPEELIQQRGGSGFRIKRLDELEELAKTRAGKVRLLRVLRDFNESVALWCKDIPTMWLDFIEANEFEELIRENKDKKRKTITVYR